MHKSFGVPSNTSNGDQISVPELDEYARNQWESVLGYMVGSTGMGITGNGVEPSGGVKTILQWGNLVVTRGRAVEITKDGFAFILQEVNAQVWTILILYLQNAPEVGLKRYGHRIGLILLLTNFSSVWMKSTYSLFSSCSDPSNSDSHTAKPISLPPRPKCFKISATLASYTCLQIRTASTQPASPLP